MIEINAQGAPRIIDETPAGRLHLDGNVIVAADAPSMRERRKLAYAGCHHGRPWRYRARARSSRDRISALSACPMPMRWSRKTFSMRWRTLLAERGFAALGKKARRDEDEVEEAVRRAVRREANRLWGKKPVVEAMVLMT